MSFRRFIRFSILYNITCVRVRGEGLKKVYLLYSLTLKCVTEVYTST